MTPPPPTPLLVFDGDCGFCTASARWLERRLPSTVSVAPWQQLDLDALGLTEADVTTSAWWVGGDGPPVGRQRMAAAALRATGRWWGRLLGAAMSLPGLSWVAGQAYDLVARNRHRLPGSTEACRLPAAPAPQGEEATGSDGGSSRARSGTA